MANRVVWKSKGRVSIEEYEPRSPGGEEVLARTHVSLISPGTERAFLLAKPNTPARFPQYPGYSAVGQVVSVGARVTSPAVGDRVAYSGSHESHTVVDASQCIAVPSEVTDEEAAFFNVVAMVSQAVRKVRIELGESVVVFGAGLMGCLAVRIAKHCGALPAVSIVRSEERRAIARKVGADAAVTSDDELGRVLVATSGEVGASVAIDATDDPNVAGRACAVCKPRGRVLLLGSARGVAQEFNFYRDVYKKGLTIIGAHASVAPALESSTGYWTRLQEQQLSLRLLASGRLVVSDLISSQFYWEESGRAYEQIANPQGASLATLLHWQSSGQSS